jgi:hypothetical protein
MRKGIRRSSVSLHRKSFFAVTPATAWFTSTERKKGGRMGSGKSAVGGKMYCLNAGSHLFLFSEFRSVPMRIFSGVVGSLKKLPVTTKISFVRYEI